MTPTSPPPPPLPSPTPSTSTVTPGVAIEEDATEGPPHAKRRKIAQSQVTTVNTPIAAAAAVHQHQQLSEPSSSPLATATISEMPHPVGESQAFTPKEKQALLIYKEMPREDRENKVCMTTVILPYIAVECRMSGEEITAWMRKTIAITRKRSEPTSSIPTPSTTISKSEYPFSASPTSNEPSTSQSSQLLLQKQSEQRVGKDKHDAQQTQTQTQASISTIVKQEATEPRSSPHRYRKLSESSQSLSQKHREAWTAVDNLREKLREQQRKQEEQAIKSLLEEEHGLSAEEIEELKEQMAFTPTHRASPSPKHTNVRFNLGQKLLKRRYEQKASTSSASTQPQIDPRQQLVTLLDMLGSGSITLEVCALYLDQLNLPAKEIGTLLMKYKARGFGAGQLLNILWNKLREAGTSPSSSRSPSLPSPASPASPASPPSSPSSPK